MKYKKSIVLAVSSMVMSQHALTAEDGSGSSGIGSILEEIIVTAQKREQGAQDVSVSITAFSGETMKALGVVRPRDIAAFTPGLTMNASAIVESDPIFTLRGVGMNDVQSNQNPSVTPYVDDVALASHVMVGFQIFDIDRVEVLKGPQGTLYGRNTTGGGIKFISNKPTHDTDVQASVNFGELSRFEFEGAVGGGLSDTLSGRFATKIARRDGWQTLVLGPDSGAGVDENNGEVDRESYRGTLLWEPSEDFTAQVVFDYALDNSEVLAFEHAGNLAADGSGNLCSFGDPDGTGIRDEIACASFAQRRDSVGAPAGITPELEVVQDRDGPRTVGASFSQGNKIDMTSWGIAPTLTWELPNFTVTSVTAFRDFERTLGGDQGGTPFVISDTLRSTIIESFSQELRLASNENWDKVKWVAGLYYSKDELDDSADFDFRDHAGFSAFFNSSYSQNSESLSVFAQAEWDIAEKWRLITGARYTDEDRDLDYGGSIIGFGPPSPVTHQDSINSTEVSGKIGIDYIPNDDLLVYANVSRGFKGAGFPAAISFSVPELTPYDSETLTAYEVGFKSTFPDSRIRLNAAAYYYDWQDFQASAAQDRADGVRVITVTSAGDVEIIGAEVELTWQPVDQLAVQLGLNLMDADIVSGEYLGQTPAHTPDLSFNGLVRYDASEPLFGEFAAFAQVDFSYTDDVQFILPNHPAATEKAHSVVNLRAGVKSQDGRWEFAGWVKNAGDKLYRSEVFGPGSGFLPGRVHYGPPKLVGVSLSYSM